MAQPSDNVALSKPALTGSTSLEQLLAQRRSIRDYQNTKLELAEIGQLLWAAQGVTDSRGFRTAPSAGALYPLELYVVAGCSIPVTVYLLLLHLNSWTHSA